VAILVVNLSQARHLDEFVIDNHIMYLSPRLKDDIQRLEFHCDHTPEVSRYLHGIQIQTGLRISVIVTYVDVFGFQSFAPRFENCDVPIIAIVGDSHHGRGSIHKVNRYLQTNHIDHVCLKQTKGQQQLFSELGYSAFCFPVYLVNPTFLLPTDDYAPVIAAYGSSSPYHYRRSVIIEKLIRTGLPIVTGRVERNEMFAAFNKAAITLNIPLNSDVNYRFHEAIAAGSCLLTEELGPVATRFESMQASLHYESFANFELLVEQCRMLLSSKSVNYQIRQEAHVRLRQAMTQTSEKFTALLNSLSSCVRQSASRNTDANIYDAKINAYEKVQEMARRSLISPAASQNIFDQTPWPESFNPYDYSDIGHYQV